MPAYWHRCGLPISCRGTPQPGCPASHADQNEVRAILHAHLIPPCRDADLFGRRVWLAQQVMPDDECAATERHLRELDRLSADLGVLDTQIAQAGSDDPAVKRLLTITGVNLIVAAGLVAAIGDVRRFTSPQKLVSYVGLNPRVRQSGLGLAQHGRISKRGRSHARAMLVEAAWAAAKAPAHCARSSCVSAPAAAIRLRRSRWRESSPSCAGIC
jgi:transposase